MTPPLIECVPNISEGRDQASVDAVTNAIARVRGTILLHRSSDADHHRSVITFAGSAAAVAEGAFAAVSEAAKWVDLTVHSGVHPRLGALDVLPFVPVRGATLKDCVVLAHEVGGRIWNELAIPVYFYAAAALQADRSKLENVRRGQFEGLREAALLDPRRRPDLGGPGLHPTAGAVIVGARKFLIAYNINLRTADLELARRIAAKLREGDGGLPGIKALGIPLPSRSLVQVSFNITDYEATSILQVFEEVRRLASLARVDVEESELIGLVPRAALPLEWAGHLKLVDFSAERYIEDRIDQVERARN